MKKIIAALIVALAIVFHAAAPYLFDSAENPEVEGWIAVTDGIVCTSLGVAFEYVEFSQMFMDRYEGSPTDLAEHLEGLAKLFVNENHECEKLRPGQVVRVIPERPIDFEPKSSALKAALAAAAEKRAEKDIAQVRYVDADGIEKRGYISRSFFMKDVTAD